MSSTSVSLEVVMPLAARRRPPLLPILVVLLVVVGGILAPVMTSYSPYDGILGDALRSPAFSTGGGFDHLLGTDKFGRDVLTRILYGARVSLVVSFTTIILGGLLGTALGVLAGYWGGWIDGLIMRFTDMTLSLPIILLAIVLATVLGPSLWNVVIVLAALIWPRYARQARAETLTIKEKDFIALAQVAGCSNVEIVLTHVLPNVLNTLIVLTTLQVGWVILLEASLGFLGVGVPPPEPSWGSMVAEGRGLITSSWWVSLFPGLAILVTVLSINVLGDWLRDTLDPKLRQI